MSGTDRVRFFKILDNSMTCVYKVVPVGEKNGSGVPYLNTLRYIHANPKAAGMQQGFFYDFSNYGTHDRLTDDGLTKWHPAFLSLGKSLEECAARYRGFCKKYKPKPKPERSYCWGSKLLPKVVKGKRKNKASPGQMRLPWDDWEVAGSEVREVTANCYDPRIASQLFQ